jgi:hypothetical protein
MVDFLIQNKEEEQVKKDEPIKPKSKLKTKMGLAEKGDITIRGDIIGILKSKPRYLINELHRKKSYPEDSKIRTLTGR